MTALLILADGWWDVMLRQMAYAAVVFGVVWAVTRPWRGRSPRLLYAFWGLVALRLVLPVDLASPVSLATLWNQGWGGAASAASVALEGSGGSLPAAVPGSGVVAGPSMLGLLALGLWATAALVFAVTIVRRRRPFVRLAKSSEALDDPVSLCLVERWRGRYGIRRRVRAVTGEAPVGPFTVGTFRPLVWVPRSIAKRPQLLEAALAHELAHVRRFDDVRLCLQDVIRAVWVGFLPIHWAVARMRRERERICDEMVVARGRWSRSRYVAALNTLLREGFGPARAVPGLAFEPDRSALTRKKTMRFESLVSDAPKIPKAGPVAYAAVLLLLLPMAPMTLANAEGASASTSAGPAMINPLPGQKVTSNFGKRKDPFKGGEARHGGIDLSADASSRVLAPADGTVKLATERWEGNEDWGTVIILDHGNGTETRYAHLASLSVKEGDTVKQGQVIATPGNTGKSRGRHLHFEVWEDGERVDPASRVADWR